MVKYIAKKKTNIKKRKILDNPVEDFLKNNPNVIFSSKKIASKLNIKNKKVVLLALNSDNILWNKPLQVGSNKKYLNVYSYISN